MTQNLSNYISRNSSYKNYFKETDSKIGFYTYLDSYNVSITGSPYKKGTLTSFIVYNKKTKKVSSKFSNSNSICSFFFQHYKIDEVNQLFSTFNISQNLILKNGFFKLVFENKIHTLDDILSYLRSRIFKVKCDNKTLLKCFVINLSPHYLRFISDPENLNYSNIDAIKKKISVKNLNLLRLMKKQYTCDTIFYEEDPFKVSDFLKENNIKIDEDATF